MGTPTLVLDIPENLGTPNIMVEKMPQKGQGGGSHKKMGRVLTFTCQEQEK